MVLLARHVSLSLCYLHFFSIYLLSVLRYILLQVSVSSVFFIQQEPNIVNFLLQSQNRGGIRVVFSLKVIVLQQFLVLQMSVLPLNIV